jgi:hypothetical protein
MTTTERFFAYWQDSLNFLLGVLLLFSPWLFGFGTEQAAALNAHVVGAIIAVMALLALFAFKTWEEWVSGVLGAWLVISPWVLGFHATPIPMVTHVLIGIAAIVLAIWSTSDHGAGHLAA